MYLIARLSGSGKIKNTTKLRKDIKGVFYAMDKGVSYNLSACVIRRWNTLYVLIYDQPGRNTDFVFYGHN